MRQLVFHSSIMTSFGSPNSLKHDMTNETQREDKGIKRRLRHISHPPQSLRNSQAKECNCLLLRWVSQTPDPRGSGIEKGREKRKEDISAVMKMRKYGIAG